jgi:hypothetical protein
MPQNDYIRTGLIMTGRDQVALSCETIHLSNVRAVQFDTHDAPY